MRVLRSSSCAAVALVASLALGVSVARGDVTTTLSGSSLVVTGDSSPDTVTIEGASDGVVVVGFAGTLVNGSTEPVTVPGVQKLTVKLLKGDDRLTLTHLTLAQRLDVRLGRGDDSVELDAVHTGAASIQTGNAYDAVFIYGPASFDSLWVDTSNGNDLVVVAGAWVPGNVDIDTGADDDEVNIVATQIGDDLDVRLGNDDDFVVLEDVTVDDDTELDGDNDDDVLVFAGYVWFEDDLDIDGFGDDWWWWGGWWW